MKYIYFAVNADYEYLIPVSMIRITRHHDFVVLEDLENRYSFSYESYEKAKEVHRRIFEWLYEPKKDVNKANKSIFELDTKKVSVRINHLTIKDIESELSYSNDRK